MRRPILALCAVGLLLACCGPERSDTTSAAVTSPADSSAPGSAPAGVPEALQFSAPLVGGGSVDFNRFSGQTVALWFWAPT